MVRTAVVRWTEDHIPRRAAALAFYAGFSLAPLLLIAIAFGGMLFGADAVQGRVVEQLQGLLGPDGARAVETVLRNTRRPESSVPAAIIGALTLLIGASGVFGELQDALNEIWKVRKKPGRGWRGLLRDRFLSYTFVLGSGFLLLVSLLVSAVLQAMTGWIGGWLTYPASLQAIGMAVSFGVAATLFAMMFKLLPDAQTRWRDVWLGAAVTALLFNIGKGLIGLYLGHSAFASSYGAAGSFVVLLMWLFYSSQVVLLGAELTHAYAHEFGRDPVPNPDAVSLEALPPREQVPIGAGDRK